LPALEEESVGCGKSSMSALVQLARARNVKMSKRESGAFGREKDGFIQNLLLLNF
jgi:hypothetical protein